MDFFKGMKIIKGQQKKFIQLVGRLKEHHLVKSNCKIISGAKSYDAEQLISKNISEGFIVSYKNSGKISEYIRIAIIWRIVTLSPITAEAKSVRLPGAYGFT